MSNSCKHSNPLKRQGTTQAERYLKALDPDNVELHGLDTEEWLEFAYEYARLVNYYASDDANLPEGDWQDFFAENGEVTSLLEDYGEGTLEPHLALFVAFLKLLTYPQQGLNKIPKRHLDFYYKEVLQLKKKPFQPDRVHVLFKLAQNAKQELIEEDVLLNAGKDSNGKPLHYETTKSLVVNEARVASLKAVHVDNKGVLRAAPVVNSADGEGAEFKDEKTWPAFGISDSKGNESEADKNWPESEVGFYIASELLYLKEGTRKITLDFTFEGTEYNVLDSQNIKARFTGEKKWSDWLNPDNKSFNKDKTKWSFTLENEKDPVVGYNKSVHKASLQCNCPVMEITFPNVSYGQLKDIIFSNVELKVDVEGIESLDLQSPLGDVDPSNPFMPFGPQPVKGSTLSITYPGMAEKPITSCELGLKWLNLPNDFFEYYSEYGVVSDNFEVKISLPYQSYSSTKELFEYRREWVVVQEPEDDSDLFVVPNYDIDLQTELKNTSTIELSEASDKISQGTIKLHLQDSFYHDQYPELYANTMLNAQDTGNKVDLPNKPYTPLLDSLKLSYTAQESIDFTGNTKNNQSTAMFHKHPFGTKWITDEIIDIDGSIPLIPHYNNSTLYIGLDSMKAGSNVSLLFQVAEGSENPAHSSFEDQDGTDKISWEVLSENKWISVEEDIIRNETNHFLRSGLLELTIPQEATNDNSLLKSGLHWLRIHLNKKSDAVCNFLGVHAQATKAVFKNNDNSTEHLKEELPAGSISQLVNPRAHLESVSQPYPSFGGQPAESDDAFYRRVSERLRHKDRAVSIWDYEHLVLQDFPDLYKVKCLNHTKWDEATGLNGRSPGHVTLVLIPKITKQSSRKFRLRPRASQDFRNQVQDFIASCNSPHASAKAVNPDYEPVKFKIKIVFDEGLDDHFYRGQAKKDLTKWMAPWAYKPEAAIRFGGHITKYEVVNYLENLSYVNFIEDFKMYKGDSKNLSVAEPETPRSILVPSNDTEINSISRTEACES